MALLDEIKKALQPKQEIPLPQVGTADPSPTMPVSSPVPANLLPQIAGSSPDMPTVQTLGGTVYDLPVIGGQSDPVVRDADRPVALPEIASNVPQDRIQPFVPEPVPALPVIGAAGNAAYEASLSPVQRAENRVNMLMNEKARDNDKSFAKKLGAFGREALLGIGEMWRMNPNASVAELLAGGGVGGAARYALNPAIDEQRTLDRQRGEAMQEYQAASQMQDARINSQGKVINQQNILDDNERQWSQFEDLRNHREAERERKLADRLSREKTSRMTAVAGILKSLPAYDPNDPRFAQLTQMLGDVNLPITPKDARKKVDMIQDQRTGEWTVAVTDPVTGKQEVRPVVQQGGGRLVTTPTVVMQGELGLLRQNDQQEFTAQQNAIKRQFDANMETAKSQFKVAYEQMRQAYGDVVAQNRAIENFKSAFRKANGTEPTAEQVENYRQEMFGGQ